jgi:hypothetical protein
MIIQPHKTPDSCLEMQRQPGGLKLRLQNKDAPGSCRGRFTDIGTLHGDARETVISRILIHCRLWTRGLRMKTMEASFP